MLDTDRFTELWRALEEKRLVVEKKVHFSATRLGYFEYFIVSNFLTKVAQINILAFWAISENVTF